MPDILEDLKKEGKDPLDHLQELVERVRADAPKGMEGNKQAARRSRNALNDIKKLCTPLRQQIQDAVKKPS